jgi:tricorn protease
VPVDAAVDPWAPFVGKADAVVALTLSDKPTLDAAARKVLVKPVASDAELRYRAWVERNRAHVEQVSGGKVGYIHVPDTGVNGQNNLFRQFYGQIDKPALIIDERWNGGGQIPTRFIELLKRPATNFWTTRDSKTTVWPPDSHQGPMCMLINQRAGSGGDAFPYYFRQAKLGPLIGVRTWGGLVGIGDLPDLLDGASVSVPGFAFYELDGTWGIEGYGVPPDVEVIDDPALMVNGAEPQLDKAIALMLDALKNGQGFETKPVPPYPDRSGMGLRPEDR